MDPSAPGELAKNTPKRKEEALSNAMRKGKRALAGVAAAALGMALIPFVATTAQAATAVTEAALDGPLRVGVFKQQVTVTGTDLDSSGQAMFVVPNPGNPSTLYQGDDTTSFDDSIAFTNATTGTFDIGNASVAGTYQVRVCVIAAGDNDCNSPVTVKDFSFSTTGLPASVSVSPATQESVPNFAATYTATVKDGNGNVTQMNASESVVVTAVGSGSSTATPGTTGFLADLRSLGEGTFTVANNTAGSTSTISVTPSGSFFGTPGSATLTTGTVVPASKVALTSPTANASNEVPAGSKPLVFTLSRDDTTVGDYFEYRVTLNSTPDDSAVIAVDASGTATLSISPENTSADDSVTVAVSGGTSLTVTYKNRTIANGVSVSAPVIVAKPGDTVTITGAVQDQFGAPVANASVTGVSDAGVDQNIATSNALTGADGTFSVTFTGSAAVADDTTGITITANAGALSSGTATTEIVYTESGSVELTGITLGTTNVTPANFASTVVVPFTGSADDSVTGGTGDTGNQVPITAAAAFNAPVTYTVTGGFLSTSDGTQWDEGETTVTAAANTEVFFFSTTVGTATVTATAGDNTLTADIPVVTTQAAAYNMAISPESQRLATGAFGTVTVTVTDVFGNPVSTTGSDDTGAVTVTASGEILLAGLTTTVTDVRTGTDGTATVTVIAGNAAGVGTLAIGPTNTTGYWAADPTLPPNAPAPVTSAAATVTVGTGPTTASIILLGERGTVRGKPGILVEGATQGIADGTVVRPFIKFPGQTSYTMGTAQRTVAIVDPAENIGEFAWQRRTGKKIYVYFRTEDGSVQSPRIIIPAR